MRRHTPPCRRAAARGSGSAFWLRLGFGRRYRTDGRHVAKLREDDREPGERDDDEVELAPGVTQVRVPVEEDAIRDHLHHELEGEDVEVHPLADVDKIR